MGTVTQFRLPDTTDRRRQVERRNDVIQIDSRQSLVHPSYQIKVPVLRHPKLYNWANELDE